MNKILKDEIRKNKLMRKGGGTWPNQVNLPNQRSKSCDWYNLLKNKSKQLMKFNP